MSLQYPSLNENIDPGTTHWEGCGHSGGPRHYQCLKADRARLVALLKEALEVLPARGNLRRRIIQTLADSNSTVRHVKE